MRKFILLFASISFLLSCSPKIHIRQAALDDLVVTKSALDIKALRSGCYDPQAYVEHPELMRIKYIRINLHFMNSSDGKYNIPEHEIYEYAREWIFAANDNLDKNMKMFLPHGNNTPALPIPYRYVITPDPGTPGDQGIYYHIDDELCYAVKTGRERNISDKRVIKKYAVRPDSVMNVFIQTHQLDSIPSRTYKPDISGISLGSSVKIFGQWFKKPSIWDFRGIINHEIGHSLGLAHTWSGVDGCDDTPPNPNCWNVTDTSPCDSMLSNNMMDYNAHQAAITPCQIGKVLMNMEREGSIQRNILEPRWCHVDTSATITVTDSVRWRGAADLEGNVIIESGGKLEIGCRISLPAHATITVMPGGSLILLPTGQLHNSCGQQWDGILLGKRKKEIGKIIVMEGGKIEGTSIVIGEKT